MVFRLARGVLALGVAALLGLGGAEASAPAQAAERTPSPEPSASSASALPSVPTIAAPRGDSIRARQYWLTQYGITDLWEQATGAGVTVAVIDTGVDGRHQDLQGNVVAGYDASTGQSGPTRGWEGLGLEPEHGTLVASVIAGHGHKDGLTPANAGEPGESAGMLGVAPDATILPISLELGTVGAKTRSLDVQIPDAVRYAVDQGADIINLSVGSDSTSWPLSWDEAFAYAEDEGVLVIASAGNRGAGLTQVGAPATMPGVLSVGGVDQSRKDSWSSSSQGISIAVSAPSEAMIGAIPDNRYATWSGTSAAAPVVAGVAALIMEAYPELTAAQVIQRIVESADDAGADGRDSLYGYGIINPARALDPATADDAVANPLGSMRSWMAVHRKSTPSATPQPVETPVHEVGEAIPEAAAPTPVRPVDDSGILPLIVLAAFGLWLIIITVGSVRQLTRLLTRQDAR